MSELVEVQDVVHHSHLPIIHDEPIEKTGNSVRLSEESVGTGTEATSVLATRGSQSTDSQDSLRLGLKPYFEKQVGGLPVVKEENHIKAETKRLSLHSHGSRLTHRLALAFSASSPALSLRNQKSITGTSKEGTSNVRSPDVSENLAPPAKMDNERSEHFTDLEEPIRYQGVRNRLSSPRIEASSLSALAQLDSASFVSRAPNPRQENRSTDNSGHTALSSIIRMFNHDLTIRAGITSGQMERNLLRMIEAERQRCIATGIVWNHRQIDRLSWLILEVQSLVSV